MMQFRKLGPSETAELAATAIHSALLAGKRVAWFVAGGSCIPVAVSVAAKLRGQDFGKLTVTLTDERYGAVGHTSSNWQQLLEAGFELPGARLVQVLRGKGRGATARDFAKNIKNVCNECEYRFGLFGMGADGHTAGLFPGSSALQAAELATDFAGNDYERITMTPAAIARLDEAVLYATSEAKRPTLDKLTQDISSDVQPAQVLKRIPKLTICNDYKEGNI